DSRVQKLSREHPAIFIAFDLLVDPGGRSLLKAPLRERRAELEKFARTYFAGSDQIRLSPATTDVKVAKRWLNMAGGDLDGIIAKRLDIPYAAGERTGMEKIK